MISPRHGLAKIIELRAASGERNAEGRRYEDDKVNSTKEEVTPDSIDPQIMNPDASAFYTKWAIDWLNELDPADTVIVLNVDPKANP